MKVIKRWQKTISVTVEIEPGVEFSPILLKRLEVVRLREEAEAVNFRVNDTPCLLTDKRCEYGMTIYKQLQIMDGRWVWVDTLQIERVAKEAL